MMKFITCLLAVFVDMIYDHNQYLMSVSPPYRAWALKPVGTVYSYIGIFCDQSGWQSTLPLVTMVMTSALRRGILLTRNRVSLLAKTCAKQDVCPV